MSSKNKVPCDRNGNPVPPRDVNRRVTFMAALAFVISGAILLPAGLLLLNLMPEESKQGELLFLFAMLIFLGSILLLYGIALFIMRYARKLRTPSDADRIARVVEVGEVCDAVVVSARRKSVGKGADSRELNVYRLEYRDRHYKFTRRFETPPTAREAAVGDTFIVHYLPDSNIGYYVETEEGGMSDAAK